MILLFKFHGDIMINSPPSAIALLAIAFQNSVVVVSSVYLYHTTGSVYSFLLLLFWANARVVD